MQKLKTVEAVYINHLQNAKSIGENGKYNLVKKIKEAIDASNCGIKIKQAIFV